MKSAKCIIFALLALTVPTAPCRATARECAGGIACVDGPGSVGVTACVDGPGLAGISAVGSGGRLTTGLYSSLKGFGVTMDILPRNSAEAARREKNSGMELPVFINLNITADMLECLMNRSSRIGIKASLTENHIIFRRNREVPFILHAGPGVTAGFCPDFNSSYGVVLALSGNVGCRWEFKTGIAIDAGFTLELGGHLTTSENVKLSWYRGGVYGFPAPEIRIVWMIK